jgi:hypothetical protein
MAKLKVEQRKNAGILDHGKIAQKEIEEVVSLALKVLKDMMLDTEAPIETRFNIALRIFEMFGRDSKASGNISVEEGIIRSIEKNAHDIEKNAHHLTHIETLLQLVQQNSGSEFQDKTSSHKEHIIIEHS